MVSYSVADPEREQKQNGFLKLAQGVKWFKWFLPCREKAIPEAFLITQEGFLEILELQLFYTFPKPLNPFFRYSSSTSLCLIPPASSLKSSAGHQHQ